LGQLYKEMEYSLNTIENSLRYRETEA
jgi:hypothetical protein